MKEFKIGDKVYIGTNKEAKGEIVQIRSYFTDEKIIVSDFPNDIIFVKMVKMDGLKIIMPVMAKNVAKFNNEEPKENIKDSLQPKTIGAKRGDDCKILWNRIDNLNLEFTVEGKVNIITAMKVLIKNLDLKEFKYERVCPYKIVHEYPKDNSERNHVFIVQWVDFNGEIQSQEILRADDSLSLENCTCKVFIPDFLEVARTRRILSLDDNIYKVNENRLSGVCNDFKPIIKVNRDMFEKQGWEVPKSFEERFMNYKRF